MLSRQNLAAIAPLLIATGGGLVAGSAVHMPQWWNGVVGLILIVIAFYQARSRGNAALVGFLGGVAYFFAAMPFLLAGYHSIGISGAMPVVGVIALYALVAAWWAPAFALAHGVRGRITKAIALTVAWIAAEALRSWVFPAIPTAQIASIWSQTPVIQLSHYLTVEVLSGLTLAVMVSAGRTMTDKRLPIAETLFLVVAGSIGITFQAKPYAPSTAPKIAALSTTLPQDEKWDDAVLPDYMADLTARTRTAFADGAQLVAWPETAVPYFPDEIQNLAEARPPEGKYLALGMLIPIEDEPGRFTNSLVILDHQLQQVARYDKQHLFPFGEYIPLAGQIHRLFGLSSVAASTNALAHGTGPDSLTVPGFPATLLPAICYEGSFRLPRSKTGDAIALVISNDAWWEGTRGGYFVEQEARMRAIEAGVPMIRVANMQRAYATNARGEALVIEGNGIVSDQPLPHYQRQRATRVPEQRATRVPEPSNRT